MKTVLVTSCELEMDLLGPEVGLGGCSLGQMLWDEHEGLRSVNTTQLVSSVRICQSHPT